jgi:hypothetical protein
MASKNERRAAELGMTLKEYKKSDEYKSRKSGSSGGYSDVVNSILSATPGFQDPVASFEEIYTDELQAEDRAQAEALFKPYFAQQIADQMEDLRIGIENDSVDYNRTMRQGRVKMARGGGAVGSEREMWEEEVGRSRDTAKQSRIRSAERAVGSENIRTAGYNPLYNGRVGTLTDDMNAAIEEQSVWYRTQRANRYYGDASRTYQQSTGRNILGQKL